MVVIELEEDREFLEKLQQAGPSKPVFVDFFATWCGPCRVIAPVFEQLSNQYSSQAVFLKVDVDKLEDTAQGYTVTAMPTFMCFKNRLKQDEIRGANPEALTAMVRKWASTVVPEAGSSGADEAGDGASQSLPKGQMNLHSFMDATRSECLNESDDHKLEHAWGTGGGYLESDVDEQLIITVAFNQQMKLHSLRILADGPKAPKTVRLFLNLPNAPDFDSAESMVAVQEFTLTEEDMKEGSVINLKYVKFQSVQSVTMFVKDNQGGEETTQIDHLAFIGTPVSTTNMNDFKRVAGKAGESH